MNILDAAIDANWAIDRQYLEERILPIAARTNEVTIEALEAYRARSLDKAERASVRDGVAILSVDGPLFRHANLMTDFSGATSYDVLRRDLQVALDNMSVRAILLSIDSPGGEVSGAGELAKAIRAAAEIKPVQAYIGGTGASAAYWLAAAASRIVIDDSANVGSIGVVGVIADSSERDAKSGIKRHQFVSSQSPHKRPDLATEDGRGRIQGRVDALADVMIGQIADLRGVTSDKVVSDFGQGDVLIGKAAVAAGLADAIGTFEQTLAELSTQAGKSVFLLPFPARNRASTGATMSNSTGQPGADVTGTISRAEHETLLASARATARAEGIAEGKGLVEAEQKKAGTAATARIKSILGSEEAKGREVFAAMYAFETEMSAEASIAALKDKPKAEAPRGSRLDALVPQPRVAVTGPENMPAAVQINTPQIYASRAKVQGAH